MIKIEQRKFKIDWFKCYLKTEDPDAVHINSQILEVTPTLEKKNVILGNKHWDEMWGGENYTLMVKRPPSEQDEQTYNYCVELSGKFLTNEDSILKIKEILDYHLEPRHERFWMSRIDLALDFFPYQGFNLLNWEKLRQEKKLKGYRSSSRIISDDSGNNQSTMYLGSRESEQMVRLYAKKFDDDERYWDRWELELKGHKADQCVENFHKYGGRYLLDVLFGSIRLTDDEEWINEYKLCEGISLVPKKVNCSIEKTIKFLTSINASIATVQEFLGPSEFQKLMNDIVQSGRHKLKDRHLKSIQTGRENGITYEQIKRFLDNDCIVNYSGRKTS